MLGVALLLLAARGFAAVDEAVNVARQAFDRGQYTQATNVLRAGLVQDPDDSRLPFAPTRFSTTTGWPTLCESFSPITRAAMSGAPPGGMGTMMHRAAVF